MVAIHTGFGSPDGEMWLGNENIYHLTNQDDYALQILLLDWEGNRAFAEYDTFRVHGNPDNYAIEYVYCIYVLYICSCSVFLIQNPLCMHAFLCSCEVISAFR